MSAFDPYRLWVEFKVKDDTFAGFAKLKKSIGDATAYTTALKKEIADIRAQSMVPTSAIGARQQMLRLAQEEAGVREKLATTANLKEKQSLDLRLQALRIAQREMSVKRSTLAFQEAETASAEKSAAANAAVTAVAKDLQAIRERGLGQLTEAQELRRESLRISQEEAQIREQMATTVDLSERAALQSRLEALGLAKRELDIRRQTLVTDEADRKARLEGLAQVGHGLGRAGTTAMWTGAGVLGGLAYATQKAMVFDQTAVETDLALGGYNRSTSQRQRDVEALKRAAMRGSEATGYFSALDIMEGLKSAASAGSRPMVEAMGMNTFAQIVPALSQYMDVLGRIKGESADSAAKQAIQTAHMFSKFTPDAITQILNEQAMLALAMPDKMSTATRTLSYLAPVGMSLAGMPQEAILAFVAASDQTGLSGSRGAGARLKDYVEQIVMTQSPKSERAKRALGLQHAMDANGNLDIMKSFQILMEDRKVMGAQQYRDLIGRAFLKQGSPVAALFADPYKQKIFEANRKVITDAAAHGDLETVQNILKGTPLGKEAVAMARLNNDIIEFGRYGIPIATKFFDTINPKLKEFGDWMNAHPKDADALFENMLKIGEGLLLVGGGMKVLGIGLGVPLAIFKTLSALKMAKDIGLIARSIQTLAGVETAAAPAVSGLAAVGGISAGAIAGAVSLASIVGAFLYGASKNGGPTPTGQGWETDARLSNYGLGYAAPSYSPVNHGKTKADLPQVYVEKVEFVLPKGTPQQHVVAVKHGLQSLMGTNPTSSRIPKPKTVGGMLFH